MAPEAAPPARRADSRAVAALVLVQVFFGTFPAFGKLALREVSPLVLASFRAVFGAVFLTLAARLLSPGDPPIRGRDRRTLWILSLLGIVANQLLFIEGLARTTATNATLLLATIPVFTLAAGFVSGLARPGLRRVLGVPLALGGIVFLLDPAHLDFGDRTLLGNLLVVANSLCYSVFLVASREILMRRSALGVTAAIFRYGTAPILFVALPDLLRFRPSDVTLTGALSIAGVVLFATVLAYSFNAWALARTDAATAAVFVYVQPVIAGTLAWLLLNERPGPRLFVSALLIFAGVALTTWPERRWPVRSR